MKNIKINELQWKPMEINEDWKSRWLKLQMPQRLHTKTRFSDAPREQSTALAVAYNLFKLLIRLSSISISQREKDRGILRTEVCRVIRFSHQTSSWMQHLTTREFCNPPSTFSCKAKIQWIFQSENMRKFPLLRVKMMLRGNYENYSTIVLQCFSL